MGSHWLARIVHGALVGALLGAPSTCWAWTFTDVTTAAGLAHEHGYAGSDFGTTPYVAGGVATGDYDNDGWVDLYLERGDATPNALFRNRGDGTFEDVTTAAGVGLAGARGSGPTFADVDGDGWLDLLLPGIGETWNPPALSPTTLFRNRGDGTFENITATSGLALDRDSISAAFGDYDRDGDLDLFLTHWGEDRPTSSSQHLWRNDAGVFTDVSNQADLTAAFVVPETGDIEGLGFTPNFADIDDDGWPDLLFAADFGASRVFVNDRDGTFTETTTAVISDENGMGAAVGDYDRDGDLDWFVSSIYDPDGIPEDNWGVSGNRLYRNLGNGTFEDATDAAGVRAGFWGWGSTFADLDNDGHLDLVHVNGWPLPPADAFFFDPSVCFVSNGDGTFTERAAELGLADTDQGRGLVAFDYDRDGDLDLLTTNNQQAPTLYRNDGGNALAYLRVSLRGQPPNTHGIGARVEVTSGSATQLEEIRAGSNYVSQNPAEAHFGLGTAATVDEVRVRWPNGTVTIHGPVAPNQHLTLLEPGPCGNGVVETGEACDEGAANATAGSCCSADCTLRTAGAVCRAAIDACDVAETCSGASPACPTDAIAPAGTICRLATGPCDVTEECAGLDTACPTDGFQPDGAPCSDGLPCTVDACASGICVGTTDLDICLDDFQCYGTRRAKQIAASVPETADLANAFETGTYRLKKARHLCEPADGIGSGILDAATHLVGYQIKRTTAAPKHVPRIGLVLSNVLGSISLDTRKADLLLTPATVDPNAPPTPPNPLAHHVDSYKCYKARVTKNTPKLPRPLQLTVEDEFTGGPVVYDLKSIRHLCTPVDVNGTGIREPERYLVCYKARPASGQPRHEKRFGIHIACALGAEGADTRREDELCLPSALAP